MKIAPKQGLRFSLTLICLTSLLGACGLQKENTRDRNDIMFDDLYAMNQSLERRISRLEDKLLNATSEPVAKPTKKPRAPVNRLYGKNGKLYELNDDIFYGKSGPKAKTSTNPSKPARSTHSSNFPATTERKSYAERAKELTAKALANGQASNAAQAKNNDLNQRTKEQYDDSASNPQQSAALNEEQAITASKQLMPVSKLQPELRHELQPELSSEQQANYTTNEAKESKIATKSTPRYQTLDNEDDNSFIDQESAYPSLQITPREKFKAGPYRLTETTAVVTPEKNVIAIWEKGTSFTSKRRWGDFYKVNGYFIKGQWVKAKDVWLIPISHSFKRY